MNTSILSSLITVGVVEDSVQFRTALQSIIDASGDLRCTCAFANGAAALANLPAAAPDVVLMDLQLPDTTGVECTFKLKSRLPGTQFMIFTVHEDTGQIFNALKAGASGYLLKRTPPDEILAAIRDLHHGGAPMSSEIARKVVLSFRSGPPTRVPNPAREPLSPRQEEILRLLSQGHTVKEIAEHTGLTVETVRSYLKLVYQKLHVRSRTEALLKYLG